MEQKIIVYDSLKCYKRYGSRFYRTVWCRYNSKKYKWEEILKESLNGSLVLVKYDIGEVVVKISSGEKFGIGRYCVDIGKTKFVDEGFLMFMSNAIE